MFFFSKHIKIDYFFFCSFLSILSFLIFLCIRLTYNLYTNTFLFSLYCGTEKPHYKQCTRTKCLWNQANSQKNVWKFLRLFLGWKSSKKRKCFLVVFFFLLSSCFPHIFTNIISHIFTVIGIDACNVLFG